MKTVFALVITAFALTAAQAHAADRSTSDPTFIDQLDIHAAGAAPLTKESAQDQGYAKVEDQKQDSQKAQEE